jgi:hypothetical protein
MRFRAISCAITGGTLSLAAFSLGMTPVQTFACACGCGIFDVGTSSMLPDGPGGLVYLQFYYQNQNQNWSGTAAAPGQNNGDKNITTEWITAGLQYFFNRSWGIQAEIPYENRWFTTDTNFANGPPATLATVNWADIGDIRLKGIYTGFSEDMSTGITFGIKFPTGNYNFRPDIVDRDTQIGTGSTDLLLGVFHRGALTDDGNWGWYTQLQLDLPVLTRDDYTPGTEIDFVIGAHYKGWSVGQNMTITPIAQVLIQERTSDTGANASNPVASGFQRVLLAPGIEVDSGSFMFYADVSFPVYINATGNQLNALALYKAVLAYKF